MADGDTGKSMEEKFAEYSAKVAARGTFPVWDDAPTQLVKNDDLPWAEAPDGSAIKLLHVDLNQGLWVSLTRLPPAHKVIKHFHTGFVYAVTLQGMDFPRFDGQFLIYRTGCFHAENEEPVPCGIQGAYCCVGPIRAQRGELSARV